MTYIIKKFLNLPIYYLWDPPYSAFALDTISTYNSQLVQAGLEVRDFMPLITTGKIPDQMYGYTYAQDPFPLQCDIPLQPCYAKQYFRFDSVAIVA